MWTASDWTIGTVSVRGSEGDTPALRAAMSGQLRAADLRPPGLPPAALLIVRRLRDPLPGRLTARSGAVQPDPRWQQATRQRMVELYRHAASPSAGPVPAGAAAVVFSDEAEMIAHLVLDLSQGRLRSRWWWQTILRRLEPGGITLPAILCRQARRLPAIAHHLDVLGGIATVAGAMDSASGAAVLEALISVHGLRSDFFLPSAAGGASTVSPGSVGPVVRTRQETLRDAEALLQPPWRTWLAAKVVPDTAREAECLFGSALGLRHRPLRVTSQMFGRAVKRWWTVAESLSSERRQNAPSTFEERAQAFETPRAVTERLSPRAARAVDVASAAAGDEASAAEMPGVNESTSPRFGTTEPQPRRETRTAADDGEARAEGGAAPGRSRPVPKGSTGAQDEAQATAASKNPAPEAIAAPQHATARSMPESSRVATDLPASDASDVASSPASRSNLEVGVETELSGVLYLINLILHLDLPECFEADWKLASGLGPWGLLEVMGRMLVDLAPGDDLALDPLWVALADIDGRPAGNLPGGGVAACEAFRLPPRWLEGAGRDAEVEWAASSDRLWLWTATGFLLVTCPRSAEAPSKQARRELGAYFDVAESVVLRRRPRASAPLGAVDSLLTAGLNPHLGRWLSWAMPYLLYRLEQACGKGSVDELLRCRGRLYVTTSHVDLVIDLSQISLSARLAGLDRDPGWIPSLGRVVKFHFESRGLSW